MVVPPIPCNLFMRKFLSQFYIIRWVTIIFIHKLDLWDYPGQNSESSCTKKCSWFLFIDAYAQNWCIQMNTTCQMSCFQSIPVVHPPKIVSNYCLGVYIVKSLQKCMTLDREIYFSCLFSFVYMDWWFA